MNALALLSPSGRLGRGPFALAVLVVYLASFVSQVLLAAPVTGRAGLWPFALAQAVLIWAWLVLHARRLHDTGQGIGLAIGIAIVYLLMIVLLLLIMAVVTTTEPGGGASLLQLFAVLYLFKVLTSEQLGAIGYWLAAFAALMLAPVVIAFGFSIWTATRPPAPPKP